MALPTTDPALPSGTVAPEGGQRDIAALSVSKLDEEIRSLITEREATRWRQRLDIGRFVLVSVGVAILFWLVQRPDSIVRRSESRDAISRERARLILDWMKESDIARRREALAVIRAAYGPGEDAWVRRAEDALLQKSNAEATAQALGKLVKLLSLRDSLSIALGAARSRGDAVPAARMEREIVQIDADIAAAKLTLAPVYFDTSQMVVDVRANGLDGPLVVIDASDTIALSWSVKGTAACNLTSPATSGITQSGNTAAIDPTHPWYPRLSAPTVFVSSCTDGNTHAIDAIVVALRPEASVFRRLK